MGSRGSAQANITKQGQNILNYENTHPIGFRDEIHNITWVIL